MKNILTHLLILITLFFFFGCAQKHVEITYSSSESQNDCWNIIRAFHDNTQAQMQILDNDIDVFQVQFEQFLALVEISNKIYKSALQYIDNDTPIPSSVLEETIKILGDELSLFDSMADILTRNTCWYEADAEKLQEFNLKPLPATLRVKGMLLELAATVALYDAYINMFSKINSNERLRQYVDHGDSGYGVEANRWKELTERISDIENLSVVREYANRYANRRNEAIALAKKDDRIAYLDMVISGSKSYKIFLNEPLDQFISYGQSAHSAMISENLTVLRENVAGAVSGAFGNIVGTVEVRKGKLYGNKQVESDLDNLLRPGDILLEKTPFRLTDRLIPGYWGHAAMWVGNEKDLRSLGLWDHETIKKYHAQIEGNQLVAEALREGTVLNPLAHFLNIDDLVVLRLKNQSESELQNVVVRVFRQLGKEYDFNFDVETTDKIVCSQLVYIAFPQVAWPTNRVAGRFTISPDNIAMQVINSNNFDIIELIVDGNTVQKNKQSMIAKLLAQGQD